MIQDLFRSTFRAPGLASSDWEGMRLTLLQRSLLLLVPVNLVYTIFTGILGHPILPSAVGLAMSLGIQGLLLWRPGLRQTMAWTLAVGTCALLYLSVSLWGRPQPAPGLLIAALMGTLGLMLDGAALGAFVFACSLGVAWRSYRLLLPDDSGGPLIIALMAGLSVLLFVVSLGWYRGLTAARAALKQESRRLTVQRDERQVLSLALFHELRLAQERLAEAVGTEGPVNWTDALERAEHMQARAMEIRHLRNSFPEEEAPPAGLEFSRGVMLAILWTGIPLTTLGFLLRLFSGMPGLWHAMVVLPVFGFGVYKLRGGRPVPTWLAWSPVLLTLVVLGLDTVERWGQGLPAINAYWCLAILVVGLLQGWRSAITVALGGVLLVAAAAGALPPGEPRGSALQFALVLAFGCAMMLAICLQGLVWQESVVRAQEEQRRLLTRGLLQRRRLLGTLFHDAANPLMALLGLCDQARAGLAVAGDEARVRRLVARLGELLRDSQGWLMAEDPSEHPGLGPVDLEPVLAGVADLFQERLAAKRLGLSLEVEAGLRVTAQAAVLRDSVLGNLVSNAIKFSRAGSSLELEAHREDGQAMIELRDRGPGLDPSLIQALAEGRDLPSAPGTGGEAGLGLGLALAREHLQRMGGRLELLAREGGGTIARLWLKAA